MSERAENLKDVLDGKPYPPAGSEMPKRGQGVTHEDRVKPLPNPDDFTKDGGRHRRR